MSLYTKRGGLKKLLKDFTKAEIATMFIELQRKMENSVITSYNSKEKKSSKEGIPGNTEECDVDLSIETNGKSDNSFILNPILTQDVIKKSQVLNVEEKERDSECEKIENSILDDNYSQKSGDHIAIVSRDTNSENFNTDGYFTPQFRHNMTNKNIDADHDNPESHYENVNNNHSRNYGVTNLVNENEITDKIEKLLNRIEVLEERCDDFNKKQYILEKKVAANNQYTRINNIEMNGIEEEIPHEDLLPTVIRIINQINVPVNYHDIEACHRLYKKTNEKGPAKVIVRFFDRKNASRCHKNKKNLGCIDKYHCGLSNDSNIYIYKKIYILPIKQYMKKLITSIKTIKYRMFGHSKG